MAKFLVYLIESGLCLTLFYLGYVVFFRKETYFTFNRLYLMSSMVLALLMPLVSVSMDLENTTYLSETINKYGQFRSHYEELILLTDPDYAVSYINPNMQPQANSQVLRLADHSAPPKISSIYLLQILFYLYIVGLLIFLGRFLVLIYNLLHFIKKSKTVAGNGYTLVLIEDEVPSFSFMKWIFVNKQVLSPEEFEQVLSHEKVHVNEKHSVDLLLVQLMVILQWFNPLTWRIRKSLKTCHEYIADRQVLKQGHELFDYQSLLLSQLISIRSVELVNNFNLLSIKKRIAMMNKIKSGRIAKLKAFLIIPILTIGFFFFANMTERSLNDIENTSDVHLTGFWIAREKAQGKIQMVEFKDNKLITIESVKENHLIVNEYESIIKRSNIILTKEGEKSRVSYTLSNNELVIEWDDDNIVSYVKQPKGSRFVVVDGTFQKVTLPQVNEVKTFDNDFIAFRLFLNSEGVYYEGKKYDINGIESLINSIDLSDKPIERKKLSVLLEIDMDVPMVMVDKVKMALRNNDLLKIGYVAKAKLKELKGKETALFMLLPPKDAVMVKEELIPDLFKISSSKENKTDEIGKDLGEFIKDHRKYVMLYEYDNKTLYSSYLSVIDAVFSTVHKFRKEDAFFKNKNYDLMNQEEQKEIRKKYPITLTLKNIDLD